MFSFSVSQPNTNPNPIQIQTFETKIASIPYPKITDLVIFILELESEHIREIGIRLDTTEKRKRNLKFYSFYHNIHLISQLVKNWLTLCYYCIVQYCAFSFSYELNSTFQFPQNHFHKCCWQRLKPILQAFLSQA